MATVSELIARFACGTDYGQLPTDVVTKAKVSILDCVGVALAGLGDKTSAAVRVYVQEMGGKPEATLIASGARVPAANAALANGVASHVLDYDDTSFEMLGHPTATTLPAALAVSELVGADGKELVTAYVLGVETACRLGAVLTDSTYEAGWHNTGVLGTFAATVAAGKLMRLDEAQMGRAVGVAASMASGIKKNFGTSMKSYHAGQAGSNGVRAATLAKIGLTSAPDVFEGRTGLARLLSGSLLVDRFGGDGGRAYSIADPGFAIKLYPSCAFTHGAIDAALQLRSENEIDAGEIESVECRAGKGALDAVPFKIPRSVFEAKFSMPYCLAVALLEGSAMLPQFTARTLGDRGLESMMKKVAFLEDDAVAPGYDDRAVAVKVRLADGRTYAKSVSSPRGDPSNPLSLEEVVAKYRSCASTTLGEAKTLESEERILSLERLPDVARLLQALRPD